MSMREGPNRARLYPGATLGSGMYLDDYVSLLLSGFDIPVGFGDFLQRIASINDRSDLSRLDELPQEDEILRSVRRRPGKDTLAACPGSPSPSDSSCRGRIAQQIGSSFLERSDGS